MPSFQWTRFNISKNNSKSTLLSFQNKKSLGNPQQTSSFRTCLTPEHIIKIQNLLDLIYFKAACSKYQSVNETNTKIHLNKSVFGKQEIFSRLGQIQANLMVLEFQATGDNALMQWWDNGGHHQVGVADTAFFKKNEYFHWMNNQKNFWMNVFFEWMLSFFFEWIFF